MNKILEALDRIEHHADVIYIRHQVDGKWQSVALSELPTVAALTWVCKWLRDSLFADEYRRYNRE